MQEFQIGSLSIMTGGNPTNGILLQTPIEGLDGPNRRSNSFARPGAHGATVSSQFYDGRFIKIEGKIAVRSGEGFAEFEIYRQQLVSATSITKDSNGFPQATRINFTTKAGNAYFVDVFFTDKPEIAMTSPVNCEFMVTAEATDPFIFGTTMYSSGTVSPPSGGGYVVPMIVPYISAAATGGSTVVNNPGAEMAWPRVDVNGNGGIQLTGPLTTPVITNTSTGKFLQLTYNLATGDVVKIDMLNHRITLNGASLISTKTAGSDWWGLVPGNNTITLTTTSTSDTGSMTVSFNAPYIGV